ncbi:MAG: hypothetical protein ACOC2G_03415 [Bacillota bacterium]
MRIKIGVLTLLIIIYVFCSLIITGSVQAEQIPLLLVNNSSSLQVNSLYNLDIIDELKKDFSEEGHDKLKELASRYDPEETVSREIKSWNYNGSHNNSGNSNADNELTLNDKITFDLFPGIIFEADYDFLKENLNIALNTDLQMDYEVDTDTIISANLGGSESILNIDSQQSSFLPGYQDPFLPYSRGKLGISHQASNNFQISADYIQRDIAQFDNGYTTSLGVEYFDDNGQIKANYLLDKGNGALETETGMELGYQDLASLSASYKIFDPDIFSQFDKSSSWDLGLDLNINPVSQFSIGYQQTREDNGQVDDDTENNSSEAQSNLEASFKISF